jgi:hypothetical protein
LHKTKNQKGNWNRLKLQQVLYSAETSWDLSTLSHTRTVWEWVWISLKSDASDTQVMAEIRESELYHRCKQDLVKAYQRSHRGIWAAAS